MKSLIVIAGLFASVAVATPITQLELNAVISCQSVPDTNYFATKLLEKYGKPSVHDGAYWFDGSGTMYGVPIKSYFVSTHPVYKFVGVVLEAEPPVVVENIKTAKMFTGNINLSGGYWIASDGKHIKWHEGKYTKVFCGVGS